MGQERAIKREYRSSRRAEQAHETRNRILEAARTLFIRHGYSGATIEAIAQEAGVSPLTIYGVFGNKASLLQALIGVLVGGDDQPVPLLQRPEPRAVFQEADPVLKLQRFAEGISDILERVAPMFALMRAAAKTEPELAATLAERLEARYQNLQAFVQNLMAHTALRDGVDEAAATTTVWAITSPDMYLLLTADKGWTKARFAGWVADSLVRLLLP